jgi:hypothetical protein
MAEQRPAREIRALERSVEVGIMAGMAAAVPMGIFAMIASATWGDAGFYTPMYRIAGVLEPVPYEISLEEAAAGSRFFLEPQSLLPGACVHLAVGAFYGVIFVLLARALRPQRRLALVAGVAWGLAVMLFMGLVGLPLAADVVGGGPIIADTVRLVGWPTFVAEHVIYGLGLGAWLLLRPQDLAPPAPTPPGGQRS